MRSRDIPLERMMNERDTFVRLGEALLARDANLA